VAKKWPDKLCWGSFCWIWVPTAARAVFVRRSQPAPIGRGAARNGQAFVCARSAYSHPHSRGVRDNRRSHNCLFAGVVVRPSSVLVAPAGAALRGSLAAGPDYSLVMLKSRQF